MCLPVCNTFQINALLRLGLRNVKKVRGADDGGGEIETEMEDEIDRGRSR